MLNEKPLENIELHGKFVILLSGDTIYQDDFTEELVQFIESTIIETTIEKAWIDKEGSLTIDIDSNPAIRIFVSNEGVEWPIEKWTYHHEEGYMSN